jgi:small subunit ribosomal protein S20
MANLKSSKKRVRQTRRRQARNTARKSSVKTAVKAAELALSKKIKDAEGLVKQAISMLAKAGKAGTLHKRNAARRISRLMKKTTQKA